MNHEPLAYRVDDAKRILGLGGTKIYELIGKGVLDARKAGARTLITGESLRAYVASLPKANITTGREAAQWKAGPA
jgi:hypothetical protein